MRHRLFQSAQNILKSATSREVLDQMVLPPDAFKANPASTALGVGMSIIVSVTAVGLWMRERTASTPVEGKMLESSAVKKTTK